MSINIAIKTLNAWLLKNSHTEESSDLEKLSFRSEGSNFSDIDYLGSGYIETDIIGGDSYSIPNMSSLDVVRSGLKVLSRTGHLIDSDMVAALQHLLREEGYYDGDVTEVITLETEAAMKDFLNDRGYSTRHAILIGQEELADLEGDYNELSRIRSRREESISNSDESPERLDISDDIQGSSQPGVDSPETTTLETTTLEATTDFDRNRSKDPGMPPDRFAQIPGANNYRSAKIVHYNQMKLLRDQYGIRTIVNLALDSVDGISDPNFVDEGGDPCGGSGASARNNPCEPYWAEDLNLNYHPIYVHGDGPNDVRDRWDELKGLLMAGNCLVHCTHGVDRTGAVVARWRLEVDPDLSQDDVMEYTHAFGGQWRLEEDPNESLRNFIFESIRPSTSPFDSISNSSTPTEADGLTGLSDFSSDQQLNAFMMAIAGKESGGVSDIVNPDSDAYGTFQIMPENGPSWAEQCGVDPDEWQTPSNQNIIARCKMSQYYEEFNDWRYVAIAWYSGRSNARRAKSDPDAAWLNRPQPYGNNTYPSINAYADDVMSRFGGHVSSSAPAAARAGQSDESLAVVLGDSQIVGSLGNSVESILSQGFERVERISETSTKPSDWIGEDRLDSALSECPGLIFISLGGNGTSGAAGLLRYIQSKCPSARIVWSGPPPAARPVGSTWATHLLGGGFESAQQTRRNRNEDLSSVITGSNVRFINPFDEWSGYECRGNCDGIHLPSYAANEYAGIISRHLV
jgi:hypothetical protein